MIRKFSAVKPELCDIGFQHSRNFDIPAVHCWSAAGFWSVRCGRLHQSSFEEQRTWSRHSCCARRPRYFDSLPEQSH